MQSSESPVTYVQICAAIGLGAACFLPFSQAPGSAEASFASGQWRLFFWPLPVFALLYFSRRWLKAVFCFLAALGGLVDLFLLYFLANFKRMPLVGYYAAQTSLLVLIIGWLILSGMALSAPKIAPPKTRLQQQLEKLFLSVLLGAAVLLILFQVGWAVFIQAPAGEPLVYQLPSGYQEVSSEYLQGYLQMRTIKDFTPGHWGKPWPLIMITSMPAYLAGDEEKIRQQIQTGAQASSGRQVHDLKLIGKQALTIRGQPVAWYLYEGTDESGAVVKQAFSGLFDSNNGRKVILFITGRAVYWDQRQIDAFVKSIQ